MGYWLIAWNVEGCMDIRNTVTTEHPLDFIFRMNKDEIDKGDAAMVRLVNFWSLTEEQYRKLSTVF